uniref:Mpv17-like protein n=1 Tax=Cacopsylla melanoneura TaxID=428564 RepID=A0A8D8TZ79_9HEMI
MPLRWAIFHVKSSADVVRTRTSSFFNKYPVARGMIAYSVIWPGGVLLQEKFIAKKKKIDYDRIFRFSLFGTFFVAPTLYYWLSVARRRWPLNTLRHTLTKALVEQVTYTPFAMISFYFGMTLLEGKTVDDGLHEVSHKFWPTYRVGVMIWPIAQIINYSLVSEKNRVPYVSICSLLWTSFLAYMKYNNFEIVQ